MNKSALDKNSYLIVSRECDHSPMQTFSIIASISSTLTFCVSSFNLRNKQFDHTSDEQNTENAIMKDYFWLVSERSTINDCCNNCSVLCLASWRDGEINGRNVNKKC